MENVHQQFLEYSRLYKETDMLYATIAEHSGISPGMFWSLYTVCSAAEPCTAKDICGCCAMSKQTVHSALQKLEWEGYIRLEPCAADRRSKEIVLLEKGEKYAAEYLRPLFRAEVASFCALSEEDRTGMLRGERLFFEQLKEKMLPIIDSETAKEK